MYPRQQIPFKNNSVDFRLKLMVLPHSEEDLKEIFFINFPTSSLAAERIEKPWRS